MPPLVDEAARAASRDLRTFVIGSPGSEGARESLSDMAAAGGTGPAGCDVGAAAACHLDMTRERDLGEGLRSALGAISDAAACWYAVPSPSGGQQLDPARVNVFSTPTGGSAEPIARTSDPACREGWRYSSDRTQVGLCPDTCARVRGDASNVTFQFGCETRVR